MSNFFTCELILDINSQPERRQSQFAKKAKINQKHIFRNLIETFMYTFSVDPPEATCATETAFSFCGLKNPFKCEKCATNVSDFSHLPKHMGPFTKCGHSLN